MDPRERELPTIESLAAYRPGLTALARRLVHDSNVAEDLVQSTYVRALEARPEHGSGRFAWLRAVLINEARQRARAERRRAVREARAAADSKEGRSSDVAARFESTVLLMTAVRNLEPAHREVILLRFFDELPPRKIASALGVPVKTIDSRIQRALARLRDELDAGRSGDRQRWLAALAPLSEASPFFSPLYGVGSLLGVLTVKAMVGILVVTFGLVTAVIWLGSDAARDPQELERSTERAALEPPVLEASASIVEDEPSRVLAPADEDATVDDVVGRVSSRRGRLCDLEGAPLPGVELRFVALDVRGVSAQALTDASGEFEFESTLGVYRPECSSQDHALLIAPEFEIGESDSLPELRLFGAATRVVSGLVVDDRDDPIRGVELDFTFADEVRVRLGEHGQEIRRDRRIVASDARGRFEIAGIPEIAGVICQASKPGYARVEIDLRSMVDLANCRIVLNRTDASPATLEGVVFDLSGAPFQGARVGFGGRPATSDENGRFRFDYDAASPPEKLLACTKGLLPVEIVRPDSGTWPSFLEVRFSSLPKAIAGVVLDERGQPLPQARVWIADSTPLAAWDQGIWVAESVVSGNALLRIQASADDRGRFRIEDLLDREYGVKVLDGRRAWIVDAGRVHAGEENLVIRLRGEELIPRLSGRVVDSSSRGVAGASVFVRCLMLAATSAEGMKYYDTANGPSVDTDADGNFVIEDVPAVDATLDVTHDGFLDDASVPISADSGRAPLLIKIHWRCDFRLEVPANSGVVGLEIRDRDDHVLPMYRYEPGSIAEVERAPIVDGKSEALAVSDAAATMVWIRRGADGSETRESKPIVLTPGELTILR